MKFVAMITRTLKPGKTYEDYRKAWFHSKGFGVPTAMYTVVNMANPREIISIGIIDCDLEQLNKGLQIEVEDRLNHPLEDVIESTIVRNFGVVAAVDDFSAEGDLTYVQPQVDGRLTDFNQLPLVLESIANEIRKASFERDRLRKERGKYLVSTIDDRPQKERF